MKKLLYTLLLVSLIFTTCKKDEEVTANTDDGSCIAVVNGCTDPLYSEYDPLANTDDGTCAILFVLGCTNSNAPNYNALAELDDGTCIGIGDNYQGGIIFYIFQLGDAGYVAGQVHGLISAPSDQSTGAQFGCFGTYIYGAGGKAIGTGNQNTIDIEAGCTTSGIAADICANYYDGTYDDWFLPSKDELMEMYLNKSAIGGFANSSYWSSSESLNHYAWRQGFVSGNQITSNKNNNLNVRAVRAF